MKIKLIVGGLALAALLLLIPKLLIAYSPATFPYSTLVIDTAAGQHLSFNIEVAKTEKQSEQGLMYRRTLEYDAGMLFVFPADQVVNMWMKNTYLPLDMIFMSADGVITKIAANTVPQSLDIISSDTPVRGVLEINAGVAATMGIRPGDKVISSDLAKP